jgi:polygalacturonase
MTTNISHTAALLGLVCSLTTFSAGTKADPIASAPSLNVPWGIVYAPSLPKMVCTALQAHIKPSANGSIDAVDANPDNSQPDTERLQQAIDHCPSGQAVKLVVNSSGDSGFLSGPLKLKSGVTLWIDSGVTLFASRNPADYDRGTGICGTATTSEAKACNPLILADSTADSGIVGDGIIDGRGGSLLTKGPNAFHRSWWDVAFQNKSEGLRQQNPILIRIKNGRNFTLYGIAIINSPNFHVLTDGIDGITAWGIKILSPSLTYTQPEYACPPNSTPDKVTPATCYTPETVKNTDGFDPAQSTHVLLANSYISTGDDHVAVKAHGNRPSTALAFVHNHFYYGHGMSIGSETDGGLNNLLVEDLSIDGHDSPGSIGLRIKSDASRGGHVDDVSYRRICMRNIRQPLVFDTYYRQPDAGERYPSFTNISIAGLHDLGSRKYGSGELTFAGYAFHGERHPITIALDNVVFDGAQPTFAKGRNGAPAILPAATYFTLGPGTVSFAQEILASHGEDIGVRGNSGTSLPLDCSQAFVPFKSVLSAAPL